MTFPDSYQFWILVILTLSGTTLALCAVLNWKGNRFINSPRKPQPYMQGQFNAAQIPLRAVRWLAKALPRRRRASSLYAAIELDRDGRVK